jgi:ABC-2 type transport system permease protein
LKAFTNMFVAQYKQFVRDKVALFFTFLFPVIFVLVFGWAFGGSEVRTFDVGIVNQDESPAAVAITQGLDTVTVEDDGDTRKVFDVKEGDLDSEQDALEKGDLDAVIVIPEGFGNSLLSGQQVSLQIYHDPSQTGTAQVLLPTLQQVVDGIEREMTQSAKLINLEEHSIQSRELKVMDFLVPGILGMQIMFTGIYGCLPIIQQRQAHILKRLGCTPLRRSTLVFSELLFRMVLVLVTTALIIAVGRLAFDVQMVGNWFVLCGIACLGTLAFVCIGYLIAAFIRTEQGAEPIINIITFPMMFLSGTFFPVENFPNWLGPVVKALPLTYLGDALRQIMVDGAPLYPMTTDIIILGGWLVVTLAITIRFFRWD